MTASPSTAPRSIRLQVWLPLALLIVCALVFFLLTLLEHWHAQQDLQRFSQRTAHAQLLSARRALETVLRRGDGSGTDAIVADLARIFHRSRATNEYGIALVCPKIQVSNLDQRAGNAEAKLYRRN